jgi:hypothetical protein
VSTSGPKAPSGKYLLHYGYHDGTRVNRELCKDTEHDSPEAVRAEYDKVKAGMAEMGYRTWIAEMIDDQGNRTQLDTPSPYC